LSTCKPHLAWASYCHWQSLYCSSLPTCLTWR
jgi:hypothetical protein